MFVEVGFEIIWNLPAPTQLQLQRFQNFEPSFEEKFEFNFWSQGLSIGNERFTLLRVDGDTLHAKGKGSTMAPLTVQKSNQDSDTSRCLSFQLLNFLDFYYLIIQFIYQLN